ncbi:MAG: hypothetical protein V1691_01470 [Chloroflexota bacterium]
MPARPSWRDEYWKKMDRETERKIRSMCPRCGSSNTYYNLQFKTWRCGRCENIFFVKGLGDAVPWWKRLFRR